MLEKEIQIGHLILRNRLVMAPVDFELSDLGTVSARELAYYDARTASGDIGLVVAEHAYVHPNGRAVTNQLSIAKDADVPGLTQLVDLVHGNKTPIFLSCPMGARGLCVPMFPWKASAPAACLRPCPEPAKGSPSKPML